MGCLHEYSAPETDKTSASSPCVLQASHENDVYSYMKLRNLRPQKQDTCNTENDSDFFSFVRCLQYDFKFSSLFSEQPISERFVSCKKQIWRKKWQNLGESSW